MNVALHSVSELSTHRIGISPNSAASNIRLKKKIQKETTVLNVLVFSLDPGEIRTFFTILQGPES